MSKQIMISVNALPETQEQAIKVVEVLARAVAGIGFDEINISLSINYYDEVEEDL